MSRAEHAQAIANDTRREWEERDRRRWRMKGARDGRRKGVSEAQRLARPRRLFRRVGSKEVKEPKQGAKARSPRSECAERHRATMRREW